jgi:uncharacterized protein (TIGR03437 family)
MGDDTPAEMEYSLKTLWISEHCRGSDGTFFRDLTLIHSGRDFMKLTWLAVTLGLVMCMGTLRAQPTITSVTNESGESFLCPGGVAFVRGTGLGTNRNIGVKVASKQAYVFNAGGSFLQLQLPVDAPQGATTLTAGTSAPFNITLGQYCPGLPSTNVGGVAYVYALHDSSGAPVTAAFPAIPGELVDINVTGLGPTTPLYATGTAPTDAGALTNATPSVSIGGQSAKAVNAFLIANNPGFYFAVVRTPATISSGNQKVTVSIGGLTSNAANLPLTNGGAVGAVTNAAAYIDPALPNAAIAQGSIAIAKGKNLGPDNIAVDKNPFQNVTLGGTSVAITVGGTTTAGLMYYTSFDQIAFLVPSNTPTGTGTITVTYGGQQGAPAPIVIAPSNVGIFTVTSDGQGAGIVTYGDYSLVSATKAANCGGVYTTCGAANPGDVLTIWATGLGPVNGSDSAGAGLGVNMSQIPLTIWLGGVSVKASYQGRSGCCVGEDQIQFTVPANVPLGCAVPLSVQIGSLISNGVSLPVAAAGSRTCTPTDTTSPASLVAPLSTTNAPITFADIELRREDQSPGFADTVRADLARITIPAAVQPFFFSYIDPPALGSCQIYNSLNGMPSPPFATATGLDAGPQITVQGPNGSKTVTGGGGTYRGTVSANGSYLAAGTYTVSAPGGADVPKFSAQITIPTMPVMTSPAPDAANPIAVTRSNGMTVTWTGGQANQMIQLEGFNATDNTFNTGADFLCSVPASAGTFTVPPSVLMALPAGSFGGLTFRAFAIPATITGTGLTVAFANATYESFATVNFK